MQLDTGEMSSEGAASLLAAALESVKCPVCSTHFTAPVALPCGHSLCRSCTDEVSFRCCLCSKPFRTKQLIVNSSLESVLSDLLSFQAELCALSAKRGASSQDMPAPTPASPLRAAPALPTGGPSPTSSSPRTPRAPRSVFECGDYVSVRNCLSYEMSQGILEQAIERELTPAGAADSGAMVDSWTERPDLSPAADSPPMEPSPRAVRGARHSGAAAPTPTLTPEISMTQFQAVPVAASASSPARGRNDAHSALPSMQREPSEDTHAQLTGVLSGDAVAATASSSSSSMGGELGSLGSAALIGTPLSPEIDVRAHSARSIQPAGEGRAPSPVLPMEGTAACGPCGDEADAGEAGACDSDSRVYSPAAVSDFGEAELGTPTGGTPDSRPASLSTMDVGSLDPWGIQLRNELREMKMRLKRQIQDAPEEQREPSDSPKKRRTDPPECTDPPVFDTASATDTSALPNAPHEWVAMPSQASPETQDLTLTARIPRAQYRVAAAELSQGSIEKLQICRDRGYVSYGDLVFSEKEVEDVYNIFIVECRSTHGSLKLCSRSVMYIKALCVGAYVVDSAWLDAVVSSEGSAAPDPFEVNGSHADNLAGGPNRARTAARNGLGQLALLRNVVFCLDLDEGAEKQYKLSANEIRWIIFFCGGKVVDSRTFSSVDVPSSSMAKRVRMVRNAQDAVATETDIRNRVAVLSVQWLVKTVCIQELSYSDLIVRSPALR